MSNPHQPRSNDGRFGTVDHPAAPGVSLSGLTADDLSLSAQLDAEVATRCGCSGTHALAVGQDRGRGGVLRQWPRAAYLQMDYSDQRYGK